MSTYDAAWTRQEMITIDNSGAGASPDVEIVVQSDWDDFWLNVQSDGDDIRITAADGVTLENYALSGWDFANKTVTIQVDAPTLAAVAGMYALWIHWGNAAAADASTAVTITAAVAGYIELGGASTHQIQIRPENPGTTRPRRRVQKSEDEELFVWFNVADILERRRRDNESSILYELPFSAVVTVTDGGAAQATMVTVTKQRFVFQGPRGIWIRAFIKGGTTATEYTLELDLKTHVPAQTAHRILEPRALLSVQNVSEA